MCLTQVHVGAYSLPCAPHLCVGDPRTPDDWLGRGAGLSARWALVCVGICQSVTAIRPRQITPFTRRPIVNHSVGMLMVNAGGHSYQLTHGGVNVV